MTNTDISPSINNMRHFIEKEYMREFTNYFIKSISGKINRDYQKVAQQINYLHFLPKSRSFEIIKEKMKMSDKTVLRSKIMADFKSYYPAYEIKLSQLKLEYYDRCLHRFLDEMLRRSFRPKDTCWNRYAQTYKCVNQLENGESLDSEEGRSALFRRIKLKKKELKEADFFLNLTSDQNGLVLRTATEEITTTDKVLGTCKSIEKKGWNKYLSNKFPIIIGYSKTKGSHDIISGRHRIASLMYLYNIEAIKNLTINCHYIEYPFDTLKYTRPLQEICVSCQWNKVYKTQPGSHQDFKIQAGVVTILGEKAQSKWELVEKCFDRLVRGKSLVDIGAHRGMYCFKALEYGASRATAVDITENQLKHACGTKKHCGEERLNIEIRDFYKEDDFQYFVSQKYDTGIFLGVIHHLLRLGIQQSILYNFDELIARIAEMVNYGVIIEFAKPKENSLGLPEIKPYKEEFSQTKFEQALGKYFSQLQNLGKCNYVSGNKYGRFVYYATK